MIESLHISNYALIRSIDIEFDRGLNIITGETGAGKSIILGALGLIMGERADMRTVRDTTRKTIVEAVFDISDHRDINRMLTASDVDTDDTHIILRRELTAKGGSRAFINDTPVNLQLMRDVALELLDIHSQHQNLLLGDHDFQLSIIDAMADNGVLSAEYASAYNNYRKALKQYKVTADMLKRNKAEEEYLTYQLNQLDELHLRDGEQAELEHRRELLANTETIKSNLNATLAALTHPQTVTETLSRASMMVEQLSDVYDDALEMAERLTSARVEIQDIVNTLSGYDARLQADPQMLEDVEQRLSSIYSLEAKHHVDNDTALIRLREQLREQLHTISNGDETLAQLESIAKHAKKQAVTIARKLTERRHSTASEFEQLLLERARPLGMHNLRCEVEFTATKLTPTGMDSVEFMFAFNKNQPLMPVGKTASGGEISRVMLALKSIVAESMRLSTLIFDEVDTGVSGDIAGMMGRMMVDVAQHAQLITITHLPQVAALGDRHLKVFKHDDEQSTMTDVRTLSSEERRAELALMLSGNAEDQTALAAAESMLKGAK